MSLVGVLTSCSKLDMGKLRQAYLMYLILIQLSKIVQ